MIENTFFSSAHLEHSPSDFRLVYKTILSKLKALSSVILNGIKLRTKNLENLQQQQKNQITLLISSSKKWQKNKCFSYRGSSDSSCHMWTDFLVDEAMSKARLP